MESPGYPKSWIPYMTTKDCSQGLCSLYCPHWCYVALPPPTFRFSDDDNSGPTFSPLVIAIIGILASIFLLVSYYTLISKCCGDTNSRRREISDPDAQLEENRPRSVQEPWQGAAGGLDEALIKSIAVCRYKKHNGGVVEGTCSVCLSEFQEDESIRLLPTCTHAFHVPCIDTWLKSHSNCPLCRSEVVFNPPSSSSPAPTPALATDRRSLGNESSTEIHQEESENDNSPAAQDSVSAQKMVPMSNGPTTPSRNFSDVGNPESTLTIIEVSDGSSQSQQFRRSLSMDHLCRTCVSAAATSLHSDGQERLFIGVDECTGNAEAGPAKQSLGELPKTDVKRRLLHLHRVCGVSPAATLKRSFSSGRISFLSRHGRWKNATIPV